MALSNKLQRLVAIVCLLVAVCLVVLAIAKPPYDVRRVYDLLLAVVWGIQAILAIVLARKTNLFAYVCLLLVSGMILDFVMLSPTPDHGYLLATLNIILAILFVAYLTSFGPWWRTINQT